MVKRVLTSIITVAVLMGSLVACGGSESYTDYELRECDAPDAPFDYWELRRVDNKYREHRFSNDPVPAEFQLKDEIYYWERGSDDFLAPWRYKGYLYRKDCAEKQTMTDPTPISNLSQCKSDLQAVANNLNTYDDDYYDRLFKKSLQSCETAYTWNSYAPSSIANQLSAACILYSDYPVCKN